MAGTVEDYFRLALNEKIAVKMPEKEDDSLTTATRLLEKRREMAEIEQALIAQKEEFQMKMESLQQRREELEKKEFQLKESLLKFDKFLKDNDSKRVRAIKKASTERDVRRAKDSEIANLNAECSALVEQRNKLLKRLNRNAVSQKYLEQVLEVADEFHEIREIIARYDTLTTTHQELVHHGQQNQDKVDDIKRELMLFTEEKNNEILNINNRLSALQSRLDRAESDAVKWESKWMHIQNTAARKTLMLGRIKMATHNLYQVVSRHQRLSAVDDEFDVDDTCQQLIKVKEYIEDLTQITHEIRRQETLVSQSIIGSSSY